MIKVENKSITLGESVTHVQGVSNKIVKSNCLLEVLRLATTKEEFFPSLFLGAL